MPATSRSSTPVFRFAPSPNGALHLGHAYSALMNERLCRQASGRLLLRIEDIDRERCTPALEAAVLADLDWLGIAFDTPHRRQSDHFDAYHDALERLRDRGLVYPAFLSRREIGQAVASFAERTASSWPRDPDGAPLYPGTEREMDLRELQQRIADGEPFAWRLDMARAVAAVGNAITWEETGTGETGRLCADPAAWGDVILARRDTPTSYHLSVVVDDALQGITHVVRGRDLFHATSVHRLLQVLLEVPEPIYHHHDLILDGDGRKLSKSAGDTGLAALREAGATPASIRSQLGLSDRAYSSSRCTLR